MKKILFFILLCGAIQVGFTKNPPPKPKPAGTSTPKVDFRADCQPGTNSVDLDVNNVRARLLSRGDFWWDYNDAKYIVPNVAAGTGAEEISSIFAGAVWMGGFDSGGNLKLAATNYANDGNTDFYPGPLNPIDGTTDAPVCVEWDRHFAVTGAHISELQIKWQIANDNGETLSEADIPEDLKFYPAKGNPYFASQNNGFILPNQDLGSFHDKNSDDIYNPIDGDYPVIQIAGCPDENYADQIFFQIYNDNGGPHKTTSGSAIRMEVQVQAFAYSTTDELNDMTFMRYKLINRATDTIKDCYFAMWIDADLGCSDDDFVGCDTTRSLAYYYNADAIDGQADGSCQGGMPTYNTNIPLIGIDYFRGPTDQFGNELGMSSFTYHNRGGTDPAPPGGTTDPDNAVEFYNYLTGKWKDGSPFYGGDDGYQDPQFPEIKYAFPSRPDDAGGWSMAQAGLSVGDRRTVQASGPFVLDPGLTNELIIGLPWVPNVKHPTPDITRLLAADDKAQNLFDNCFKLMDGPDAPDMDIVELDQEIVIGLSNNPQSLSNNKGEGYFENDIAHEGEQYHFEGYQIFQTVSPNVSLADLDNTELSRLVAQTDVKNGITQLFNWEAIGINPDPTNPITLYEPILKVSQVDTTMDIGIRHSFSLKEDAFGEGKRLINHKKYYYVTIAYAYNEFRPFDPNAPSVGQALPYFTGRKNGYGEKILPITVIPRPSTYTQLGARYGEGPIVTRLSGHGTGDNFVKISQEERERLLAANEAGNFDGKVSYEPGMAPFSVKVVDPIDVKGGKFRLRVVDGSGETAPHSLKNEILNWILEELDEGGNVVNTIDSEHDLEFFNEQIISEYGISIDMKQYTGPFAPDQVDSYALNEKTLTIILKNGRVIKKSLSKFITDVGIKEVAINSGTLILTYEDDVTSNKDLVAFVDGYEKQEPPFPLGIEVNYLNEGSNWLTTPRKTGPVSFIDVADPIKKNFASQEDKGVTFYPYSLLNTFQASQPAFITPGWNNSSSSGASNDINGLYHLNNVDIVFTSDKSKWSRCVVVETASKFYSEEGIGIPDFTTEGEREQFQLRAAPSVGKDGAVDNTGEGMGWFPGYAIDLESGKRLNVFFGENSTYRGTDYPDVFGPEGITGGDMLFNPTSEEFVNLGNTINTVYLGGQHFVYVTYNEYDGCAQLAQDLAINNNGLRAVALSQIQWAGAPMVTPGERMLSVADGLIPNDVVVSLRVGKPYNTHEGYSFNLNTEQEAIAYGANPVYEFDLGELLPAAKTEAVALESALDEINVVPNPYYGFSPYEVDQFNTTVKITNLPAKCTVRIFSLDGKFIKKFERNEEEIVDRLSKNTRQILPDIAWNLKNASDIPIASGVYIIHVEAPGLGERVIKWFGMNRQFDPSGL